jgi:hypothetical protein
MESATRRENEKARKDRCGERKSDERYRRACCDAGMHPCTGLEDGYDWKLVANGVSHEVEVIHLFCVIGPATDSGLDCVDIQPVSQASPLPHYRLDLSQVHTS